MIKQLLHATSTGERNEDCEKYSSVPQCFLPCPTRCRESYDQGELHVCWPRVHLHTASGERDDTCERYSSVPECFKPCPAKCEQSFRDQVTITSWCSAPVLMPHYPRWRTRSARGSPPPPRCPTATTPPAPRSAWTRPRTTSVPDRWHGHTLAPDITTS